MKAANRSRKIKFFLDKMKEQENQTDSVVKLVKDLIVKKAVLWIKAPHTVEKDRLLQAQGHISPGESPLAPDSLPAGSDATRLLSCIP